MRTFHHRKNRSFEKIFKFSISWPHLGGPVPFSQEDHKEHRVVEFKSYKINGRMCVWLLDQVTRVEVGYSLHWPSLGEPHWQMYYMALTFPKFPWNFSFSFSFFSPFFFFFFPLSFCLAPFHLHQIDFLRIGSCITIEVANNEQTMVRFTNNLSFGGK